MWWIPFIWTVVCTLLLIWFFISAEGEDIMAAPTLIGAWAFVVLIAWIFHGIYCLVSWFAS